MFIMLLQVVVDLGKSFGIASANIFETSLGGLEHQPACFLLFAFGAQRLRETQYPNQRSERQPLEYQRYQDDAERQEHDQIAMWKRSAIGDGLR